ncbi:MAG: flavin reductase [Rhizobiaceae bacterium]
MTQQNFTHRDLRDALSSFATGVTIVTTTDETGSPCGMTASSFNSVSMDPPLILWSIGKNALSAPAFTKAEHFTVHILGADQIHLSNGFAKSGADKFAGVDYQLSENNVPQLAGVKTRIDCKTWNVYEGGDHWIIIGEVLELTLNTGDGLVFSGGTYATATPISPPSQNQVAGTNDDTPIDSLLIYNLSRAYKQMGEQFHQAVQTSGLSVAEWRVLASLQGQVSRSFSDLVSRTFVDPASLNDMLSSMQAAGLCQVKTLEGEKVISGTSEGDARVDHLFKLGAEQEIAAMGDGGENGLTQLIGFLKLIVKNTNDN